MVIKPGYETKTGFRKNREGSREDCLSDFSSLRFFLLLDFFFF
ncbi:hypothetical protein MmTuc01_0418 [Methanosarcina mazei Tuc01]|uniref:Uncharacterized protein n=1 Tax=Methanosarcina mazei Tuc01 TaxID=1236903 RepID=M1P634_METMZ|nr:hypothetical protein MmTuc01_0418 [Methanosarcina mazei Tuc01]